MGSVDAIGQNNVNRYNEGSKSDGPKQKIWENYAGAFGKFIGNLPGKFNSAFTVQNGQHETGASKL